MLYLSSLIYKETECLKLQGVQGGGRGGGGNKSYRAKKIVADG